MSPPPSSRQHPVIETRRRRWLVGLVPWIVAFLLIVWAVRDVHWQEAGRLVSNLSGRLLPDGLLMLLAINLVALPVFALRWMLVLRALGSPVPLSRLALYRWAAFGLAYVTPGPLIGGEPLQFVLLARRDDVPRSTALASVVLERTIELFVSFSFLLVTGAWLVLSSGSTERGATLALLTVLLLLLVPTAYLFSLWRGARPLSRLTARLRVAPSVDASEQQLSDLLGRRPRAVLLAAAVSILGTVTILAEFWLVVYLLGIVATPSDVLRAFVASRLAQFLLLPAALGALEASQVVSWRAAGAADAAGIAVSLITRARDLLFAGAGLLIGLILLKRKG